MHYLTYVLGRHGSPCVDVFVAILAAMPKRIVSGGTGIEDQSFSRPIGTWVGAGLSLAVVGNGTQSGLLTVSAVVLLAPMVYLLATLKHHAPQARTTSDFVGAVLGERFGVFTGTVQLGAYLFLAVKFALASGIATVGIVSALVDGTSRFSVGFFVVAAIAVSVVAGILVYQMSVRGIAWLIAILAAVGMLVLFYASVAVVALIASGHEQHQEIATLAPLRPRPELADVVLAIGLIVGFEVVTTINREVRSVGRSMVAALAVVAGCALIVTLAMSPHLLGAKGAPDMEFPWLATAYLGPSSAIWLLIGNVSLCFAGLVMLIFAASRVTRRWTEQLTLNIPNGAQLAGVVAVVAALLLAELVRSGSVSVVGGAGVLLVLAMYASAAYACTRIPASGLVAFIATAVTVIVAAGVVVIPLGTQGWSEMWPLRLLVAGVILLAAAGIAVKADLAPRSPRAPEEPVE